MGFEKQVQKHTFGLGGNPAAILGELCEVVTV